MHARLCVCACACVCARAFVRACVCVRVSCCARHHAWPLPDTCLDVARHSPHPGSNRLLTSSARRLAYSPRILCTPPVHVASTPPCLSALSSLLASCRLHLPQRITSAPSSQSECSNGARSLTAFPILDGSRKCLNKRASTTTQSTQPTSCGRGASRTARRANTSV